MRIKGLASPASRHNSDVADAQNDRKEKKKKKKRRRRKLSWSRPVAPLQALHVSLFNVELLFMCQNDIMPNQVVFQILIMLLEVHYLCERVLTVIRLPEWGSGC